MLCGLDPSYSRTGIAIFHHNRIHITHRTVVADKKKTFQNVWLEADKLSETIVGLIKEFKVEQIISEIPPPQGHFSPGLWCLDSLLFHKLYEAGIATIYNLGPTYVGHVHGKRSYNKSESVVVAKQIISELEEKEKIGFDMGRLNHDEAEAFIFLCRLFVINNMFIDTLGKWKGLLSSKEKLLGGSING